MVQAKKDNLVQHVSSVHPTVLPAPNRYPVDPNLCALGANSSVQRHLLTLILHNVLGRSTDDELIKGCVGGKAGGPPSTNDQ